MKNPSACGDFFYLQTMPATNYFTILLDVLRRPGMYGLEDSMDLSAFLTGFSFGGAHPHLDRLLSEFTAFLKSENPEFKESTAGWSHMIKSWSWERGGSISLFKYKLAVMLREQGYWTDVHYKIFTSKDAPSSELWNSLPAPNYTED